MGISVREQMWLLFYFTDEIPPILLLSPSMIIYKIKKIDSVKTNPGLFTPAEGDLTQKPYRQKKDPVFSVGYPLS